MTMPLTDVIIEWLKEKEWEERPNIHEAGRDSTTEWFHKINEDFAVLCYLEADEDNGVIKLFMYFNDSKIPATKIKEATKFANLVNVITPIGHLAVVTGDSRVLRYYASIAMDGVQLETRHISNLLDAGFRTMESRLPQLMAICVGGKTAEEAIELEPE